MRVTINERTTDLGHAVLHNLLTCQIRLVPDKQFVDTLRRIPVDLLKPLLDICEGVYMRYT